KGPTVKAIIRSAQNKTPFDEVKKVFNRFAKGHLTRYLRSLSATELYEINQQAFKYSNEIFYQIDRQIRKIKGLMTDFSEPLYNELNELIESLRFSGQRHRRMFDRFFNEIHELLDKLLAAAGEHIKVKGAVNSQITYKQVKASWSAIEKLNPSPEKQITVVYQYADKTPVAGAICSIFDQNKSLVAEGPIIDAPETVFQLPNHVNKLTVELHKDPLIQTYIQQPFPNPEVPKAEPGWFDRMAAALDSAGDWTLDVIAGDFNENPTLSQIITNTIITMIPVVDQVGDLRDISACLKLLIWDEKYDEEMVWVGLGLTVVGLVPGIGSLAKGILKVVFNKLPIDRLINAFNTFAKGHATKYLKELQNGGLKELQKKVVQTTYDILNTLQGKLSSLKDILPAFVSSIWKRIVSILEALEETKKRVESMFTRFFDELAESLNRALGQNFQLAYEGVPNSTIVSKQVKKEPPAHKIEGKASSGPVYGTKRLACGGIDGTSSKVFKDPATILKNKDAWRKPVVKDGKVYPLEGTSGEIKKIPKPEEAGSVVSREFMGKNYKVQKDSNGFPIFTIFETYIDTKHINSGLDSEHFKAANERLGQLLREDNSLIEKMGLTEAQTKHFMKSPPSKDCAEMLTWHHHQETGKIQLVDSKLHGRFGHVGGMNIWGGGR
ncbi:MAG: hypothetical protein GY874_20550, partial [Desulfobacteraceae bacterium]|nr:hypothetical protein [Desulfobacteraceae bacterium]